MKKIFYTSCALLLSGSATIASGTLFEDDSHMEVPNVFGPSVTNQPSDSNSDSSETPYSTILSEDLQAHFINQGKTIIQRIVSGDKIDLQTADYFSSLPLEDIEYEASYSKVSGWFTPISSLVGSVRDYNEGHEKSTLRKNYLTSLVFIMWALTDKAEQQGEGFVRGSFTLIDPEHNLYNYMLDYVKLVTNCETPQDLPYIKSGNPFAYRRKPELGGSSHHHNRSPESQFGIDVRFSYGGTLLKLMPHDKGHILFGMLDLGQDADQNLLFVKQEPVGMGTYGEALAHGTEFIHSKTGVESESRREKDFPNGLKEAYEAMAEDYNLNSDIKTVRDMYIQVSSINDDDQRGNAISTLESFFLDGILEFRTGNEVIIDLLQITD